MTIRSHSFTKRTHKLGALGHLLALTTVVASSLSALEPEDLLYYRVGNVSIRPNFGLGQSYNDNVFFRGDEAFFVINPDGSITKVEREGDFITSASGGASFLLGRPTGNYINATYSYSHRFFHEHSFQNAGNHSIGLQGQLDGARISITPTVTGSSTRSILAGANRSAALADQLIERNNLRAEIRARIKLTPKLFTTSTGRYSLNDVEDGIPLFDSDDFGFTQGFGFQIRPKVGLSLNGSVGRRTVDPNTATLGTGSSQNYFGGGISAEGDFSERLTGNINFGIQRLSFSQNSDSFVAPVAGVSLDYRMGRDITSTISYTRSTFAGIQSANAGGVGDRIGLTVRKPFGFRKNWILSASGNFNFQSWENRTGVSADRSNDWLSGTLAIQYQIQEWLSSSFSYSVQSFSSSLSRAGTFGIVDYDVNTVSLSMRIGY